MTFDPLAFTAWALARLAEPPPLTRIERHDGRGAFVLRFALPLELAKPANRSRHSAGWMDAKQRGSVLAFMAGQLVRQTPRGVALRGVPDGRALRPAWVSPLPGRPMFRAVRFSSVEPDSTAAWWKVPQDCLISPRTVRGRQVVGLGVLADDRPSACESRAWWEPAPRGAGGVLIEVWSGGET